jgi:hypothetical protein
MGKRVAKKKRNLNAWIINIFAVLVAIGIIGYFTNWFGLVEDMSLSPSITEIRQFPPGLEKLLQAGDINCDILPPSCPESGKKCDIIHEVLAEAKLGLRSEIYTLITELANKISNVAFGGFYSFVTNDISEYEKECKKLFVDVPIPPTIEGPPETIPCKPLIKEVAPRLLPVYKSNPLKWSVHFIQKRSWDLSCIPEESEG